MHSQIQAPHGIGVVHLTQTLGAVEHLKAKLNGELSGQGIRVVGTPTIVAHDMGALQLIRPLANSFNDSDFWAEIFADPHLARIFG